MARFLIVLLAAAVVAVQAGGQLGHAAPATAEVFWRTVLPRSSLPEAILRLLRPAAPDSSFVSKAEARPPFDYQDYKRPSSDDDSSERTGADTRATDLNYDDYSGARKPRVAAAADTPFGAQTKPTSSRHSGSPQVLAGGQPGHAAPATAEVFWRTVLPRSPLPDAIIRLLRPAARDTSFVSRAEERPPFDYQDYKRSSSDDDSSERNGAAAGSGDFDYDDYRGPANTPSGYSYRGAEKRRVAAADPPFGYDYKGPAINQPGERAVGAAADTPFGYDYKAPSINQAADRLTGAAADTPFGYDYKAASTNQAEKLAPFGYDYKTPSTAMGGGKTEPRKTTVFFHEEAVRVGERLPFHFPPASPAALGFLPRRVADSVPFVTPALPGVLAAFGVSPNSATAAGMEATLRACDTPTTIPGESKFCATSLEALVERAMGVLGSRDITPVTSTLPRGGAPLQTYTVSAVRPVEGGPVFVACHDEPYPYTVYRCHTTGPSRAYMVEMEGERGGGAVSIATVCHTDTSMWNPEHVSFKLLGTKPGGTPVCHLMPYGHIIWAKNVKRATA